MSKPRTQAIASLGCRPVFGSRLSRRVIDSFSPVAGFEPVDVHSAIQVRASACGEVHGILAERARCRVPAIRIPAVRRPPCADLRVRPGTATQVRHRTRASSTPTRPPNRTGPSPGKSWEASPHGRRPSGSRRLSPPSASRASTVCVSIEDTNNFPSAATKPLSRPPISACQARRAVEETTDGVIPLRAASWR